MNEGNPSRREKLKIYGDFVASYVIKHPELILGYSSYSWHEPATLILKEFYRSVNENVEPPGWLDLLAEQTIVQEAKEEKHFELVGFLRHTIQETYRVNIYADPDPSSTITDSYGKPIRSMTPVSFKQKIDHCLRNSLVPFLYEHRRNKGEEVEVVITANILSELKRYNRSQTNRDYTLAALASEIPGFKVDQRKINSENKKAVCGPRTKFFEFINPTIQEGDE